MLLKCSLKMLLLLCHIFATCFCKCVIPQNPHTAHVRSANSGFLSSVHVKHLNNQTSWGHLMSVIGLCVLTNKQTRTLHVFINSLYQIVTFEPVSVILLCCHFEIYSEDGEEDGPVQWGHPGGDHRAPTRAGIYRRSKCMSASLRSESSIIKIKSFV